MTPQDFIKGQLVALAHREASHYGGLDNMLAVMFMVRNRVRAGWEGGDWLGNLYGYYRAAGNAPRLAPLMRLTAIGSSNGNGEANEQEREVELVIPAPDPGDLTFRQLLVKVDDVFSGLAPDHLTASQQHPEGALYCCELNQPIREWFRSHVAQDAEHHPRVAKIGPVDYFA